MRVPRERGGAYGMLPPLVALPGGTGDGIPRSVTLLLIQKRQRVSSKTHFFLVVLTLEELCLLLDMLSVTLLPFVLWLPCVRVPRLPDTAVR